jgi:hypothetical protein
VTRPAAVASVERVVESSPKTLPILVAVGLLFAYRASSAEEPVSVEATKVSVVATLQRHVTTGPADGIAPRSPNVPASATVERAAFCPSNGDVVAVIAQKRELWLCHEGAPEARIRVAFGRGGLDKRRRADGKTPIGTYALGTPRPSGRFGIFIPIDYPTPEQAARGLTGAAVGIHGPPRGKSEPEYPTTAVDWTLGCVATGNDSDIEAIAEFVRQWRPLVVIH